MPHGFEYVVRPFQSPGSLGTVIIPGTPQRTQEQAHITWGAVGTMPQTKIINPSAVVNTREDTLDERDRDSEVQRIVGNDGESYVDVARAKQVRLDTKSNSSSQNNLSSMMYRADTYLDGSLDPYLSNFGGLATLQLFKTTWNLKNQ